MTTATPETGTVLTTRADIEALPNGTRLRNTNNHNLYVKVPNGLHREGHRLLPFSRVVEDGRYRIENDSFSMDGINDETPTPPLESLSMYQQRFQTTIIASADHAGIGRSTVEEAFDSLGISERFPLGVGMVVCHYDGDLMQMLPNGVLIESGRNPANYGNYGVYTKRNGRWVRKLGGGPMEGRSLSANIRVLGLPGTPPQPDWLREEWTPDTPRLIHEFKQKAWIVGADHKARHRWCSEYESSMSRADVSEVRDFDPALLITTAEAISALEEGTIVRLTSRRESVIYLRDNRSVNPARTVRLGGSLPGSWTRGPVEVVRRPGQRLNVKVLSHTEMEGMPVGTMLQDRGNATRWTRDYHTDNSGRVYWFEGTRRAYAYSSSDFGIGNLYYTKIGETE